VNALRIALADDQAMIRSALAALLAELGISVAAQAADGQSLLDVLAHTAVDVVVSDIRMPRVTGLEAAQRLRARGDYTPVLLLTTFDEPALFAQARSVGAQGFLLKDAAPESLAEAINKLARGETLFAPVSGLGNSSTPQIETAARLTPREQEVLRLVAGGYSNKEIGRALNISDGTARNHLTDILAKLEARDRTHAVMKAMAARLI
jgi:DNA-binding NarL/FixJ family response regulator